jgi:hypothetical protein
MPMMTCDEVLLVEDLNNTENSAKSIDGPRLCANGEPGWVFCSKVMADDKLLTKILRVAEMMLVMTLVGVELE